MTNTLADILHLTCTARYIINTRQKVLAQNMDKDERKIFPSHYLDVPPFISDMVNINALQVGVAETPFKILQPLPLFLTILS